MIERKIKVSDQVAKFKKNYPKFIQQTGDGRYSHSFSYHPNSTTGNLGSLAERFGLKNRIRKPIGQHTANLSLPPAINTNTVYQKPLMSSMKNSDMKTSSTPTLH